jgi:inorganic triphosphatase YgiF
MTTANEILAENGLQQGTASKTEIRRAYYLAQYNGVLLPEAMLRLSRDPRAHTTQSLRSALIHLGCVEDPNR